MSKLVVISFGGGSLLQGFSRVTAQLWTSGFSFPEQFVGSLPPAPNLVELHQIWQSTYRCLCDRSQFRSGSKHLTKDELTEKRLAEEDDTFEIATSGITNVSHASFADICQRFYEQLNDWLLSNEFIRVERQLRSYLTPSEDIRITLEVHDELLCRLPWHLWQFIQDYPKAEISFSQSEYKRSQTLQLRSTNKVRVLAILGNSQGIDLQADAQFLRGLRDADITFLVKPLRQELNSALWDRTGWDILFFAGHSQTQEQSGQLYINENTSHNSITIEQLGEALKAAIDRGLKLAIFNSCDGLGLALALERLHIPVVVAMREPVPNRVAQEFFKHFLESFAVERLPFYQAMRQARNQLQGLEHEFPGASWLPMIYQNPAVEPPTWLQLGGVPPCPYRGLFAFQETDAHLFFGRETFTNQLFAAVKHAPLVAVVGASGSGKSSVVFAGLIPRLRQDNVGSTSACIISFRPGNNPFEAMAEAMAMLWQSLTPKHNTLRQKTLELSTLFREDDHALCQTLETLVQQTPGRRFVLVIDQFEELYTLCPESDRPLFLDGLLYAVNAAPCFTLVLTLRADFYSYVLSYRPFSDALQGSVYNLGPMSYEELQEAIEKPAVQMSVRLEQGLTDKLIQATSGSAGHLPLLEFALSQLWLKQQEGWLTHQAYEVIGGVEEALAKHADTVYAQLNESDRQRMQQVFVQLVQPGIGTEASRRIANRDDIGEDNWRLVSTHLAAARLVVTNRDALTGEETVEIAHEALIRNWQRLKYWIQIDSEFRHWQEDLRIARRRWERSDREEEALLRGKILSDAQHWYSCRPSELSFSDQQFIQLSLATQERDNKKRKRRRKTLILSLIAGLLAALALAGMALWQGQRAYINEVQATAVSSEALFSSNQQLEALTESLKAGQLVRALPFVETETQALVTTALQHLLYRIKAYNRLEGHGSAVYAVSISPNHQIIATASQDKTIKLWQQNGTLLNTLKHNSQVYAVAFSPDNQLIAAGDEEGIVKLWRQDGLLLSTLNEHKNAVKGVTFSHDGKMLATASWDGTLKLWNRNGTLIRTFTDDGDYPAQTTVAFSPDDQIIAAGGWQGTVKLWQLDGTLRKTLTADKYGSEVYRVVFSHDGKRIATASDDGTVKLWKLDGTRLASFIGHSAAVRGVVFSPDDQIIASASADRTVKLWGPDGTLLNTLLGHDGEVYDITFSSDGQTIASASEDKTVRLWKPKGTTLKALSGYSSSVYSVSISPNKQMVATADGDKLVKLWNLDGTWRTTLKGHTDRVFAVSFSPDGQMIASGDGAGTIKLWDNDGALLKDLQTDNYEAIRAVSFSPDGQMIASSGDDATIKLWWKDGTLKKTLEGHRSRVWDVGFSPDNQMLVSGGMDGTIRLWKHDGSFLKVLNDGGGEVYSVTFSPDSQTIASAHEDGTVRLWNRNGALLKTVNGKGFKVYKVIFSPDGKTLTTAHEDGTIKLWEPNGILLKTLNRGKDEVWSLSFSNDGKILASASKDREVILWDMERNLNLKELLPMCCNWAQDYLNTNPRVSEDDRHLCDGVRSE